VPELGFSESDIGLGACDGIVEIATPIVLLAAYVLGDRSNGKIGLGGREEVHNTGMHTTVREDHGGLPDLPSPPTLVVDH
jgi:hypothetical protein